MKKSTNLLIEIVTLLKRILDTLDKINKKTGH